MNHSVGCKSIRMDRLRRVWIIRFPDYCQTCDGVGVVYGSRADDELDRPIEECPECLSEGLCPRCKTEVTGVKLDVACCMCGFCLHPAHQENHKGAPPIPTGEECTCKERET